MALPLSPTAGIVPWSPYHQIDLISSAGRRSLISAFSDVVRVQHGFEPHELPEIFSAPEDEGENDAVRHMIVLDAGYLARQFMNARIQTFARPISGGDVVAVPPHWWEVDDPLPRMSSGALNFERWADTEAAPSHRIFVDSSSFDEWLAGLTPVGPLTNRQIEEMLDPQVRAARAVAGRAGTSAQSERDSGHESDTGSSISQKLRSGDALLTREEVEAIVRFGRQTIYNKMRDDGFPEPVKFGALSRWKKSEVLVWIEERAARRGPNTI